MKNGKTVALYLSPAENNNKYDGGILSGGASGNYYAFPEGFVEPGDTEVGMFVLGGTLVPEEYLENRWVAADKFEDITSIIVQRDMYLGIMDEMDFTYAEGSTYNISGQPGWGIWQANMIGATSEEMASDWRVALGGKVLNSNGSSYAYWLGTIDGSRWEDAELEGLYRGVSFRLVNIDGNSMINAGQVTADVVGTYEVDTTWQAAAVGEWVELATLDFGTNAENLLFRDALAQMVDVPITETYSALLQGAGTFDAGGTINAVMDISMYASASDALSGIWTSLINGNYTGSTSDSWSVAVDNGNVTLTGSQWSDGQWLADVTGTVNNATIAGQAGGTYADTGTFEGVGAGTWTQGSY